MIKNKEDLYRIKDQYRDIRLLRQTGGGKSRRTELMVGLATCGIAAGGKEIYDILEETLAELISRMLISSR